jgi:hypothetical protein
MTCFVIMRYGPLLIDHQVATDVLYPFRQHYKKRRLSWVDGVEKTKCPQELCAFVLNFEKELKRSKMLDGWDVVRAKWLQDIGAVTTNSVLLYLVKQLRVYLGRQVS